MRSVRAVIAALTTAAAVFAPAALVVDGRAGAAPLGLPIDTGSLGSGSAGSGSAGFPGTGSLARGSDPAPPPTENASVPKLQVTTVLDGLDHPWDVVQAPDGTILTGERSGQFIVRRSDGSHSVLKASLSDLYHQKEVGLMGIALARDFAQSRTVYTCQGYSGGGMTDVGVQSWTVDPQWTALTRGRTLLSGVPVNGGRHGGCRILPAADGTMFVSTGDSASPYVPQDVHSLGGKTLHINADGTPAAGDPFPGSPVYTLGHRNPQGLALQPGSGRLYAIEQGTDRDDEVNLLRPGGNYGWRPDLIPGVYTEAVPMTDPVRVPGAIPSVWSSGDPTLATADGAFVTGSQWGAWDGALVIGCLKAQQLALVQLSADGKSAVKQGFALHGAYGRIRSVTATPDGSLLVTTDNGGHADQVLRVRPQA